MSKIGLVVLHPFLNHHHVGKVITDPGEIARASAEYPAHVVRRALHPHEVTAHEKELAVKAAEAALVAAKADEVAAEAATAPVEPAPALAAPFTLPAAPLA